MIDLDSESLEIIKKILKKDLSEYEVKAFGSRVTGKAEKFSDLDLVIMSDQLVPVEKINKVKFDFSNSDLPFLIDIVDWSDISDEFREAIRSDCVSI